MSSHLLCPKALLHVDFKKRPCRCVDFKHQGPSPSPPLKDRETGSHAIMALSRLSGIGVKYGSISGSLIYCQ